ncbi:MAG: hypothetical protein LAQ69_39765, partial [Acidobacteriia bacterium]|nr:hypothetical protein [Terriglobia bacterium]
LDKSSGSDGKNRSGAFAAANQVVKEVYDRTLEDQTNASVVVEGFTAALLIGRPMPLKLVQNFWLGARLLTLQPIAFTTAQNASNLLSEVILYDMLRAYTGKYVTMHGEGAGALMLLLADKLDLEEVPSNFVGVNGLNPDQREMIYKRFSTVPWKDTSRPPVNSWRDLINKWGAKRIRPAGFPQDN